MKLSKTSLSMGLRSILGIGKTRKSEGGDDTGSGDYDEEDNTRMDEAPSVDAVANTSSLKPPSTLPLASEVPFQQPLRMGEDPVSKEVNVLSMDHKESTQERINRVKSGLMTEAEKKAFLQTALTAGNTAESRRPLREESSTLDSSGSNKKRFFASPFPSDSILRNFARGGKNASDNVAELDLQKKKREYLDMVTSPDRFHRYKTYPGGTDTPPSTPSKTPIPDLRNMELKTASSTSSDTNPQPAPSSSPLPSDLGARLGVAAMASESLRQQQEQERRRELQRKMDLERRQYEQRAVDLRDWQVQMASFEMQQRELRVKEEQSRLKEEEEKKQAEKARLEALMKAQEDYWSKKLAEEKAARNKRFTVETESVATESTSKGAEDENEAQPMQKDQESNVFNPDEHELLELAKIDREEDWEENQETIEQVKAQTLGVMPIYTAIETEEDFLAEQARKKQEIDRQREEQMKRLKALSSPLPSPAPISRPPPPVFRPQVVSGPAAPLFGRDAMENSRRSTVVPKVEPSPATAAIPPSEPPQAIINPKATPVPTSGKSMWSSFLGGDTTKTATTAQPTVNTKVASPAKLGPIRMKLPLGEETEDGVDVRSNKGMSIAEAMKRTSSAPGNQSERSKKWGIDMSKFLEDDQRTK